MNQTTRTAQPVIAAIETPPNTPKEGIGVKCFLVSQFAEASRKETVASLKVKAAGKRLMDARGAKTTRI
jgi:hypothetical protein